LKIGLISDTHDQMELTRLMVEHLLGQGADYLIHAGDIGQNVAQYLASLSLKTIAVYGNTDTGLSHPGGNLILQKQPYYFRIGQTTFKLMHQPYFLTPDSDIVVYGHLHRFACERGQSLFVNPGEVCAREKPRSEGAILDLSSQSLTYCFYDLQKRSFTHDEVCP